MAHAFFQERAALPGQVWDYPTKLGASQLNVEHSCKNEANQASEDVGYIPGQLLSPLTPSKVEDNFAAKNGFQVASIVHWLEHRVCCQKRVRK